MSSSSFSLQELTHTVSERLLGAKLSLNTKRLLSIATTVGSIINQELEVVSSNLPGTDTIDNKTMVLLVQKKTDEILNSESSTLEKILECAKETMKYRAGNCQQKSFLALDLLLTEFKKIGFATFQSLPKIEIKYSNKGEGHFYLVIDDDVICDTWAQLYYPLSLVNESVYGQPIKSFFCINRDWTCFEAIKGGPLEYCYPSTEYTFNVAPKPCFSSGLTIFDIDSGVDKPSAKRQRYIK